jgi:hypothetical protein
MLLKLDISSAFIAPYSVYGVMRRYFLFQKWGFLENAVFYCPFFWCVAPEPPESEERGTSSARGSSTHANHEQHEPISCPKGFQNCDRILLGLVDLICSSFKFQLQCLFFRWNHAWELFAPRFLSSLSLSEYFLRIYSLDHPMRSGS